MSGLFNMSITYFHYPLFQLQTLLLLEQSLLFMQRTLGSTKNDLDAIIPLGSFSMCPHSTDPPFLYDLRIFLVLVFTEIVHVSDVRLIDGN